MNEFFVILLEFMRPTLEYNRVWEIQHINNIVMPVILNSFSLEFFPFVVSYIPVLGIIH